MSMILLPTRGGEASYPNQDFAIALAKERGLGLMFLYVTNVSFLGLAMRAKLVDVETEMDHLGDFLLTMAQERAEKSGVIASTTVRRGEFRKVLKEVIQEYPIDIVVLGSSRGAGVTTPEYIDELGEVISRDECVEIIIVEEGQIVTSFIAECGDTE
jgi:nucleotide-binding universal stress UspA family protein